MVEERESIIKNSVTTVARLMGASAITAPKAKGIDNIVVSIINEKKELEKLADEMRRLAAEYGSFFARDANNVENSDAVLLIGCKMVDTGIKQPKELEYDVNLVLNIINLGIAIGSAVKTASLLNVDNRVMYSIGIAAKKLGILDADIILGIPLSVRAKSIYFDRRI